MGFVKSYEEIAKGALETFDFFDAEILTAIWETKPEIVERLLPPPLKPSEKPIAVAYVANFPRTNWGEPYLEGALFLRAKFDGSEGSYCLAMPVTDDIALIGGREIMGFPKKIGAIQLNREGNYVKGWAERHGVRFFELKATLSGKFNTQDAEDIFAQVFVPGANAVYYNFKYFASPDWNTFDYNPRLVKEEVEVRQKSMEVGEVEVVLQSSDYDPWVEVEVVRVLGAVYTKSDFSMQKASVVAEVDPATFAPYSSMKVDR
jgi:acetoacetate decarboxylase